METLAEVQHDFMCEAVPVSCDSEAFADPMYSRFSPFPAGQCYIPHPGSQKPDECCCPHGESILCSLNQIPEGLWDSRCQLSRCVLEDEGS